MDFECLYTTQKAKKQKTWHDGFLSTDGKGKISIYDESMKLLESMLSGNSSVASGDDLEMERHLVQVGDVRKSTHQSAISSSSTADSVISATRPSASSISYPRGGRSSLALSRNPSTTLHRDSRAMNSTEEQEPTLSPMLGPVLATTAVTHCVGLSRFSRSSLHRPSASPLLAASSFQQSGGRSAAEILALIQSSTGVASTISPPSPLPVRPTAPLSGQSVARMVPAPQPQPRQHQHQHQHQDEHQQALSRQIIYHPPDASKFTSTPAAVTPSVFHGFESKISSKQPSAIPVADKYGRLSETSKPSILVRSLGSARPKLQFPGSASLTDNSQLLRKERIPVSFEQFGSYQSALSRALYEQLNVCMYEIAAKYHQALGRLDLSQCDFATARRSTRCTDENNASNPTCPHGRTKLLTVKKAGQNCGRSFFACAQQGSKCNFFQWADSPTSSIHGANNLSSASPTLKQIKTPQELENVMRAVGIAFYCGCEVTPHNSAWLKSNRIDPSQSRSKTFDLHLSRKEKSSSYSKDDLWVVSTSIHFDPQTTRLARSAFFGPTSDLLVELAPLDSVWSSMVQVHAIHIADMSAYFACLDTIEQFLTPSLPILPYLLSKKPLSALLHSSSSSSACATPISLSLSDTDNILRQAIDLHRLNDDQECALRACAKMISSSDSFPVLLVHGVFGAGKSYWLAVCIQVFSELLKLAGSRGKILIASTTNVAVDRVLNGLLDIGFEDFVRVGSVRKIAKRVLPHSVHSNSSENMELKELKDMLSSGNLNVTDRLYVKRAIEAMETGKRKNRLEAARVVGVTTAAAHFPCLKDLEFLVVMLDECSQMTEPASLQAIARFHCRYLVLVGDPQQLPPTIPGAEPEHEHGLEQTLFDRMTRMGVEPVMLSIQYRMHPMLSAIPNTLFYYGRLQDGVSAVERAPLVDGLPTLRFFDAHDGMEKRASDGSFYNEREVDIICEIMAMLLAKGIAPADIGVVCLYKAQAAAVHDALLQGKAGRTLTASVVSTILVSTVDAFQGGEREIIILTCVRTAHVGFVDSCKRTNVALSRAKRHLFIVGHDPMLSANPTWKVIIEHCRAAPHGFIDARRFQEDQQFEIMMQQSLDCVNTEASVPSAASARTFNVLSDADEDDSDMEEVHSEDIKFIDDDSDEEGEEARQEIGNARGVEQERDRDESSSPVVVKRHKRAAFVPVEFSDDDHADGDDGDSDSDLPTFL